MAVRRLADDWEQQHGCRPVLVETFVNSSRFDGACYRAANWLDLGETRGGKGKAPKRVYVYPLSADFREVLLHGPQRTAPRRKAKPRAAPRLAADDPFLLAWQELVGAATAAATAHDRVWQLRRRVINTLLVVLFVYRLMFSGNGYTATLAALWQQCQACGIPLPPAEPVAASSMSAARAKVDKAIFKSLHAEILKRAESSQWKGHRVFAVDGSKINLPRPLLRAGYPLPQERAHYPQGLLSCLYELAPKLPIDFDLHATAMSAPPRSPISPPWPQETSSSTTAATTPTGCCWPMRSGACIRCSVCNETPEPLSTTSSQEAGRMRSSPSHPDPIRFAVWPGRIPTPYPSPSPCGSSNTSTAEPSSTSQPLFSTEADTRSGNSPTSTMTAGALRSCTKPQSVASNWKTSTAVPNAA